MNLSKKKSLILLLVGCMSATIIYKQLVDYNKTPITSITSVNSEEPVKSLVFTDNAEKHFPEETNLVEETEELWKQEIQMISQGTSDEIVRAQRNWISKKLTRLKASNIAQFVEFLRSEVGDAVFLGALPLCVQKIAEDTEELGKWAKSIPATGDNKLYFNAIGYSLSGQNIGSFDKLLNLWNLNEQTNLIVIEGYCSGVSAYDPETTIKILSKFDKQGELRNAWMNAARTASKMGLAENILLKSQEFFTLETPSERSSDLHKDIVRMIVSTSSEENISNTLNVLDNNKLKESTLYPVMVESFMDQWSKINPKAASEWLSQMPPSEVRDSGAMSLIKNLVLTSPSEAAAWSNFIGNKTLRESASDVVYNGWKLIDVKEADKWKNSLAN